MVIIKPKVLAQPNQHKEEYVISAQWFIATNDQLSDLPLMYCFAHAGGNAEDYLRWQPALTHCVKLIAICPPGIGRRYQEARIEHLDDLAQQVASLIDKAGKHNYYLFGHSLGAIVAFEVARKVKHPPLALLLSGSASPMDIPSPRVLSMAVLDDDEFIREVPFFGGISNEFLAEPDIIKLLASRLKKDFNMISKYHLIGNTPINVPIVTIVGSDDPHVTLKQALNWHQMTNNYIKHYRPAGNHFYFNEQEQRITNIISEITAQTKKIPSNTTHII